MAASAAVFLCGAGGAMQAAAAPEDPVLPIYVDPVNGNDDNDGTEWGKAMKTITAAVAKSDTAAYHNERRVCVTLAKGIYELSSTLGLKQRTSLVGDPACDRSEIVLTAPEGAEMSSLISLNTTENADYVNWIANLTVSNVTCRHRSPVDCGQQKGSGRWSQVVSNVVFTQCRRVSGDNNPGSAGLVTCGRTLVVDCLFSGLTNSLHSGSAASCLNGGWFRNCRIENCYTAGNGQIASHVIQNVWWDLALSEYSGVEGCTFSNNYAKTAGGCLMDVPVVRDCTFVDNVSGRWASVGKWTNEQLGYYTNNPPVVAGCMFAGNSSESIYSGDGDVLRFQCGGTVTNCTFSGNSTSGGCAGALNPLEVVDCTFASNVCRSAQVSSALYFTSGGNAAYAWRTPRVANCTFVGNGTQGSGGAIAAKCPVTVEGCLFEGNSASGGGDMNASSSGATVSNCVFSGNRAYNGGGIYFSSDIDGALVTDCVFTNNMAGGSSYSNGGAGIYALLTDSSAGLALTVRNCLFVGNVLTNETTTGYGSAALLWSRHWGDKENSTARIHVESCTMVENSGAKDSPPALYVHDGVEGTGAGTYVTNTVIARNYGADGSYAPAISALYGITTNIASRIGHSYFHPKTGVNASWWKEDQHVMDTDDLPAFKSGTWIPTKSSALCNAGVFQDWMDGAFDLQRNDKGKAFASRVYGAAPDIGAFERFPTGGFSIIVR